MAEELRLIKPDWPVPDNIVAFSTCRTGGVSEGVYSGLNLALHVGDNPQHVHENRKQLLQHCDGLDNIQWLDQVHSTDVIHRPHNAMADPCPAADGCYTRQAHVACAVMTADCLPVLFYDSQGQQVAAAHAGWRGLAAGVLDNTVRQLKTDPAHIMAWFGPAISPHYFEVGEDVRQAFLGAASAGQRPLVDQMFQPNTERNHHYFFDLYQLARIRLRALGVSRLYGGDCCTYRDAQRFYSYRRDGVTGRMATVIYKR